jgi:hypothetical protein
MLDLSTQMRRIASSGEMSDNASWGEGNYEKVGETIGDRLKERKRKKQEIGSKRVEYMQNDERVVKGGA